MHILCRERKSMATKIIVSGNHDEDTRRKFRELPGCEVVFVENDGELKEEDLKDVEIFAGPLKKETAVKMPKLRYVQLFSAGAQNYGWLDERVVLGNAYGAYGDAIAEHMLTVSLMAMKKMPEYQKGQEGHVWKTLDDIVRFEGSKILSVGMGAIGTSYLKKAHALGGKCYGVRRTIHDIPDFVEKLVTMKEMDELLPDMDVVALSLPGTDEVKGLFDERRLMLMKKDAILINVGRGNAVVTDDLIKVMNEGHLRAACLDVMDPEPLPKDHPLWDTERVYLTPHISGGYKAGMNYEKVVDVALNNIRRVLDGKDPVHIVNKKLGY